MRSNVINSSISFPSNNVRNVCKHCVRTIHFHGRTVIATTTILLNSRRNQCPSETYRNAMKAFIDRRKNSRDRGYIVTGNSPDKARLDFFINKNYDNETNEERVDEVLPGVPHVPTSDIFEIGCVAGTEDRCSELIYSEWQNTRISLKKNTHRECKNSIKADIQVLSEIRHPNILLLMGTSYTKDHTLMAIFESVDCTLFNYIHKQGERVSIQGIAKCAGNLAAALKHAHMRGYIHSAISPHCVFLVSSGLVKLGGWELATNTSKSKTYREYEECLRSEIFQWLAPEIFMAQEISAATDIYSLSLLMWEMATMIIPWNTMNYAEVKFQYTRWKHCIMTDLHNFPPLFKNLLDAGLQIDVSKRTIDMPKMSKFLQRIELQHEDEDPIYIEISTNDKNASEKSLSTSTKSSTSPMYSAAETPKRRSQPAVPRRNPIDKRIGSHESFLTNKNFHDHIPQDVMMNKNFHDHIPKDVSTNKNFHDHIPKDVMTNGQINSNLINNNRHSTETMQREVVEENQQTEILNSKKFRESTQLCDFTHEDTPPTDIRQDLKILKESLANERQRFFYGSNSSFHMNSEQSENRKAEILIEAKNKNYEPHKPASHKTSFEPKQNTSPSQYGSHSRSIEKSRPTYASLPMRENTVQTKVINTNAGKSFGTSSWKREKMICLSKMGHTNPEDIISHCKNQDNRCSSQASDETFLANNTNSEIENSKDQTENFMTAVDFSANFTGNSHATSLQILKNALDNASELARAKTPPPSECESNNSALLFFSPRSFHVNTEKSTIQKFSIGDYYKANQLFDDGEMKSNEKSSSNGSENTYIIERKPNQVIGTNNSIVIIPPSDCEIIRSASTGAPRSFQCKSIAETPNEYEISHMGCGKNSSSPSKTNTIIFGTKKGEIHEGSNKFRTKTMTREQSESDFVFFALNDKAEEERECFSCSKSSLSRRRSLPAALGKNLSNSSLSKIPIRRGNIADQTIEDLYIDDEFSDGLAVNMILLDEDSNTIDDDFLPNTLEFSNSCDNQ